MKESKIHSSNNERRVRAYRLIIVGIILFLAAFSEITIRIINPDFLADKKGETINPTGLPYFHMDKERGYYTYTPSRYYIAWGHSFKFVMPKPKGLFRIMSLGGSTTNGQAFGNPGAFSLWLSLMLNASDPLTSFEVINCGQKGYPGSEVLHLESQILKAAPDLIIIYCGNNEFFYHRLQPFKYRFPDLLIRLNYRLRELRIVRLVRYVVLDLLNKSDDNPQSLFDLEPGAMRKQGVKYIERSIARANAWDRKNHDWVLSGYRKNLEAMVDAAHEQGSRVILCTVAVNLRDYEPYGSNHSPGLSASELKEWDRLFQMGKTSFARGDIEAARDYFLQANAIDDTAAMLNFCLGHCCLKAGETAIAYEYFEKAVIHDPVRDRAGPDLNEIVREVSASRGVPLVDAVKKFQERSKDGVPGDDLFLDSVHPTLEGHQIIAQAILETMISEGMLQPRSSWRKHAENSVRNYQEEMPSDYLFNSYYTAASWNILMGRFARARRWTEKALESEPHNPSALKMKNGLDIILSKQKDRPNLPWSEMDLATEAADR